MAQANRVFQVFISSTFADLKAERDALQERVFPKLRGHCAESGYSLQAIDLTRGIGDEASAGPLLGALKDRRHSRARV